MNNKNISFAFDELDYLMAKVARVHGDNHEELKEIKICYDEIKIAYKENDIKKIKEMLEKASLLSNDFEIPSDACQAFTRVYKAFIILKNEIFSINV